MEYNRTHLREIKNNEGWNNLSLDNHKSTIEGRYKIEHKITIELREPCAETITIVSAEPFDDIADFTHEMLVVAERRHRARRKQMLANNRETLRSDIIPLWLEHEAFMAQHRAELENLRKESKRRLRNGEIELNEHNNLARGLNSVPHCKEYSQRLEEYDKQLQKALRELGATDGLCITRTDIYDLFGRKWWEQFLQIDEYFNSKRDDIIEQLEHNIECFNRMYNLEPYTIKREEMLAQYDSILTARFGDIPLAAALKNRGKICAVMAIDDEYGRRALRHLVGEKALAELLPKRVFNAIVRSDELALNDITYHDDIETNRIIIE